MVTRRSLLKQGAYAALALRASPSLIRTATAQTASSPQTFDFYISPNGSDTNPGTQSQPWAITAINTRRADYGGKRVGLLDGTYNVHALCQSSDAQWSKPALAVNGGANADTPTVIAAVNPRQAILTAADPQTGAYPTNACGVIGQGYMQTQNKGNVTIDGLYITRSFQYGIAFWVPEGQQTEGGTTGFTVKNCEIYDIGGIVNNNVGGILMYFCTGALISNNKIHSVQPPNIHNANLANSAGIFSFDCHSNIYEYNTIYDCNCGIHDKNANNGNHTHRYNYVECAGLTPAPVLFDCAGGNVGDVLTVHNNIFVGPTIFDGANAFHMPPVQGVVFYNNTCVYGTAGKTDSGIFCPTAGPQTSPPAMVSFYNNILQCTGSVGYAGLATFCAGAIALSDYNSFGAPNDQILGLATLAAPRAPPQLHTLASWRTATGFDGHSVAATVGMASPLQRSPTGFQLQTSSPARGMGRVGGKATGAATDLGAWGGGATQIGCNFGPSPQAVSLKVS
jgi:hypothetical protein